MLYSYFPHRAGSATGCSTPDKQIKQSHQTRQTNKYTTKQHNTYKQKAARLQAGLRLDLGDAAGRAGRRPRPGGPGGHYLSIKSMNNIYLSIYLSVCLSIYLIIYLSVYLSIYLSMQQRGLSDERPCAVCSAPGRPPNRNDAQISTTPVTAVPSPRSLAVSLSRALSRALAERPIRKGTRAHILFCRVISPQTREGTQMFRPVILKSVDSYHLDWPHTISFF